MRRSTAAAVGTLTGAALIVGVRLSVQTPDVPVAAPEPVAETAAPPAKKPAKSGKSGGGEAASDDSKEQEDKKQEEQEDQGKFKNGTYTASAKYVYGTIEISLKVTGGKISSVEAGYPTANDSGTINPPAIAKLKQATLEAQSADVDAVSGATLTSEAYLKSLQAALDKAA